VPVKAWAGLAVKVVPCGVSASASATVTVTLGEICTLLAVSVTVTLNASLPSSA